MAAAALVLAAWVLHPAHAAEAAAPPDDPLGGAAFTLRIEAPDDILALLTRHLELLRYRHLADLDDVELERLLVAARQDSRDLLATLGYFAPELAITTTHAEANGPRQVLLHVAPGPATQVQAVQINFAGAIATDSERQALRQQIEAHWPLRPGQRFTQTGWDTAKQQVLRELTATRYPLGQLSASEADIDPDHASARLSLTLDSGAAYRFGPLRITGLKRHDAVLVTRLARLGVGGDYSQSQLLEAQQRLADSGFFDAVFVSLDTTADPAAAPVLVQVREALLQKLVLGVGASTDSGARLSMEHTHHRVPGLDWQAVTKLALDRNTRSLGSEWTAPPNDSAWRWVTSALVKQENVAATQINSQQLRLGQTQSGERIDRNVYLQYDRARDANGNDVVTANALSANYAWTQRNFDNLMFPSKGYGLGVELGGGLTLDNPRRPFGRAVLRWLDYWPLGDSTRSNRLAARAQAGAVVAQADASLPSTQLFLTGGDNTVRGYSYHALGTNVNGLTVAGRYLGVGSLEWQHPLSSTGRLATWESTLFIDAGAVANQAARLRPQVGVGTGLRWRSPVGPLQIDLAYGVAVKHLRLHLNVGFSF